MRYSTVFIPRLVGVPCDNVQMAIVTQMKAMGSYKVRNCKRNAVILRCTIM